MSIVTSSRRSTDAEIVAEMDRRGLVIEKLEARIAELEAALAEQNTWRLIDDDTPRDRGVMLCVAGFEPSIGRFCLKHGVWLDFEWENHFENDEALFHHVKYSMYRPTHWRPIPTTASVQAPS